MILAFAFYPFGVYLAYLYFLSTFPRELLDAARIDGGGELQIFLREPSRYRGLSPRSSAFSPSLPTGRTFSYPSSSFPTQKCSRFSRGCNRCCQVCPGRHWPWPSCCR
jgi:hypothetical protein